MKDQRYDVVRAGIKAGVFNSFSAIFKVIPATRVADDLDITNSEVYRYIKRPTKTTYGFIIRFSKLIGCDSYNIVHLIQKEMTQDNKDT